MNLEYLITQICEAIDNGVTPHVENFRHLIDKYGDENKRVFHSNMEKKTKRQVQRDIYNAEAEAIIKEMQECDFTCKHIPVEDENWRDGYINGYIIGREKTAQETAHLHERIDELEGTILAAKQLIEADYIGEAIDLLETKSKAINPQP